MARSRRRDDDDDDDDDDRPVKKSRSRRDDDDDDDEDEDERPTRKKARSRRDDDDEDDEDEHPRKKLKRKKAKRKTRSAAPLLIVLGLVGAFVVLGGGIAVALLFLFDTPERAFEDIKDARLKRDYGRIYDRLDKGGQAEYENMKPNPLLKSTQSGKKGRELYIEMQKELEPLMNLRGNRADLERRYREARLHKVTIDGDFATVEVRHPDGESYTEKMVKQDGRWRMRTDPAALIR